MKAKKSDICSVTLSINDQLIKVGGQTIAECLLKIPVLDKISTKAILKIRINDREKEIFLFPRQVRRLLGSPSTREILAKKYHLLVNG